ASMRQWLHRDVVRGFGGAEARALLEELLAYPDVPRQWRTLDVEASTAPFLPIEFTKGDLVLRYFTTLTTLGTPHDITLQELRVESFFPADEATAEMGGLERAPPTPQRSGRPGGPGAPLQADLRAEPLETSRAVPSASSFSGPRTP